MKVGIRNLVSSLWRVGVVLSVMLGVFVVSPSGASAGSSASVLRLCRSNVEYADQYWVLENSWRPHEALWIEDTPAGSINQIWFLNGRTDNWELVTLGDSGIDIDRLLDVEDVYSYGGDELIHHYDIYGVSFRGWIIGSWDWGRYWYWNDTSRWAVYRNC